MFFSRKKKMMIEKNPGVCSSWIQSIQKGVLRLLQHPCTWKWIGILLLIYLCYRLVCWVLSKIKKGFIQLFQRIQQQQSLSHEETAVSFQTMESWGDIFAFFLYHYLQRHPSSVFSRTPPPPTSQMEKQTKKNNEDDQEKQSKAFMSKGEEECKRIVESFFQKPFQKARPTCLTNPITGECLELDLYNEDVRVAIEYNGRQHYEYVPFFHQKSRDRFQNQQYRDYLKKDMCEKQKIHLITVDYRCPDIRSYLHDELKKLGFRPAS